MSLDAIVQDISTLHDELVAHPASDVDYWFAKRPQSLRSNSSVADESEAK